MPKRWSCFVALLWSAQGLLVSCTVSQSPSSVSSVRTNSSFELTCHTSRHNALGLSLFRRFHGNANVLYLSLKEGQVDKKTIARDFENRLQLSNAESTEGSLGFRVKLSLLRKNDTNLYFCSWTYYGDKGLQELQSNGTIIIVRDAKGNNLDLQNSCPEVDITLILLGASALIFTLALLAGALVVKCRRFKKRFTPKRPLPPLPPRRPPRPRSATQGYLQAQTSSQKHTYMITYCYGNLASYSNKV